MKPKRCLFILRAYPLERHGLQEFFDQLLTFKAFDPCVSLLFLDRSVKLLDLQPQGRPSKIQGLLDTLFFYDIDEIMVERESLQDHQLALDALSIPVTIIARSEWSLIIERHDLVVAL